MADQELEHAECAVSGMTCAACAAVIEKTLDTVNSRTASPRTT